MKIYAGKNEHEDTNPLTKTRENRLPEFQLVHSSIIRYDPDPRFAEEEQVRLAWLPLYILLNEFYANFVNLSNNVIQHRFSTRIIFLPFFYQYHHRNRYIYNKTRIYLSIFSSFFFLPRICHVPRGNIGLGFKERSKERSRVVPLFYAKLPRLLVTCG